MIFQFAGDFFPSHHVGFRIPLSPFTDLFWFIMHTWLSFHSVYSWTWTWTCFAKYDFLVDFFVVTNQANYQDYSGIYTEVGITRTPRFLVTLERHLVIYLAETFVKVCLWLIRPCCLWSFSSQGTFSAIVTHHVRFPLSPFPDLLCIHGYHPTLYTVEPLLSGHLLSGHPP